MSCHIGSLMHACMHACIHTYMHTYMHAYMHTCMHTHIHACIHTCIHAHMHTYIYIIEPRTMSCHIGSRRLFKSSKFGTCDLHRTYTRALTFENVCLCALEAHSQTVLAVLIVPKNIKVIRWRLP